MYAAETGSAEICKTILERGADHALQTTSGTTALYLATWSKKQESARE